MNKPESLIMEEATIEMQNSINEISKKYNLSFFALRILLNDFLRAVIEEEQKQIQLYKELEKEKKGSEKEKCKKN